MAKLPNKLIVGIVDRDDTYTGKLGFISYPKSTKEPNTPHHSGVLGWLKRNKSQHPLMLLDNEPTSGFVINKKVGGKKPYYSEYKGRTVKARVYDPRGFEFEIDMENMCHILENSDTHKGKALDGNFVYAWMGSGSVFLLSCDSTEYKDLIKVEVKHEILKNKDLKPFTMYKRAGGGYTYFLGNHSVLEHYEGEFRQLNTRPYPFYDLTRKSIQYPKDIIGEAPDVKLENGCVGKLTNNKLINHYLVEHNSGYFEEFEFTPQIIKVSRKYHWDLIYIIFDPNEFDLNVKKIFYKHNGDLLLCHQLEKWDSTNYNALSNELGYEPKTAFCVNHYKTEYELNKNNKIKSLNDWSNGNKVNIEEILANNGKKLNFALPKFDNLINF